MEERKRRRDEETQRRRDEERERGREGARERGRKEERKRSALTVHVPEKLSARTQPVGKWTTLTSNWWRKCEWMVDVRRGGVTRNGQSRYASRRHKRGGQ
jgi:hypothetical protein